jgi:transposase
MNDAFMSMDRDPNAAINILNRATGGTPDVGNVATFPSMLKVGLPTLTSQACGEETPTGYKHNWQVSSGKQEAHGFSHG